MRTRKKPAWWKTGLAVLFWLALWQAASLLVANAVILPTPFLMLRALVGQVQTAIFWQSIGNSLLRIACGFLLGLVLGCTLAGLSAASALLDTLIRPLMQLVRSTPVASFIILALFWFRGPYISIFISFLMVLPVIYSGTLNGVEAADGQLLEMAQVFRIGRWRRFRAILLPALRPSLLAACELGLGMCWKSGVAAEVIALVRGTIGERLYAAKINLQMPEVFSWTMVIILLSWVFGKLVMWLLRTVSTRLEGGRAL